MPRATEAQSAEGGSLSLRTDMVVAGPNAGLCLGGRMTVDLAALLGDLNDRTRLKFKAMPAVIDKDDGFDVSKLPVDAPRWHRISDVVSVFFDLKSSTNLERGRRPASTASIYDAGVGGVAKVLQSLGADFIDIQGDGGFGLFWGETRYERALVAAITIRTFSSDFESQLKGKWPDAPTTGFKVGVASGPILAKRVGLPRHMDFQEPVWAGRPVNYSAKAAQQTEPGRIVVAGSVWDAIEDNDYLVFSCGCSGGVPGGAPVLLWERVELAKIPDDERFGQSLGAGWCDRHGEDFLNAILAGEKRRTEVHQRQRSERNLLASGSTELIAALKSRGEQRTRDCLNRW